MNFLTQLLHIAGSGAIAYITASSVRDPKTRPDVLAGFQMAESGSVPFLEALRDRANAEGDEWLAVRLDKHASDEKRHGQIFAHGLKQLNKKVIDFAKMQEKKLVDGRPDEEKRSPFFAAYFNGFSQNDLKPQNIDWTVFLASTYILELDASKDFVRIANALPNDPVSLSLKKGILSIADDETGHASYLQETMQQRLGTAKTQQLIDEWRTRKVNALMATVENFVRKGGNMGQMVEEGSPVDMAEIQAADQRAA
ncbi:ferritin-like domain-containing protein [Myxacorys almedinensis]|uniref:Ferritin-like domain-containing protein n=1 Tax=Myxacorys almedinensis A TaxID=2690445 RepID=A0A8J7Z391_9CYAN|nr:ferritin-like domain-containing protein [Myxacorys almedinensis]NDJ17318.1 ferritin-like domain-containing protein [Myxacorys almedinensis A]